MLNEQHLSNILFALGSMGLTWDYLPRALKVSLMAALYRVNYDRDSSSGVNCTSYGRYWTSKKKNASDDSNILFMRNGLALKDEAPTDIFFPMVEAKPSKSEMKQNISDLMNSQGLSMSIVGLCKLGEDDMFLS